MNPKTALALAPPLAEPSLMQPWGGGAKPLRPLTWAGFLRTLSTDEPSTVYGPKLSGRGLRPADRLRFGLGLLQWPPQPVCGRDARSIRPGATNPEHGAKPRGASGASRADRPSLA